MRLTDFGKSHCDFWGQIGGDKSGVGESGGYCVIPRER